MRGSAAYQSEPTPVPQGVEETSPGSLGTSKLELLILGLWFHSPGFHFGPGSPLTHTQFQTWQWCPQPGATQLALVEEELAHTS